MEQGRKSGFYAVKRYGRYTIGHYIRETDVWLIVGSEETYETADFDEIGEALTLSRPAVFGCGDSEDRFEPVEEADAVAVDSDPETRKSYMQGWDYYNNVPGCSFDELCSNREEYRKALEAEVDMSKLPANRRYARRRNIRRRVDRFFSSLIEREQHICRVRRLEFWEDARRELGYCRWLKEDGVRLLEAEAAVWAKDGGFKETFACLRELAAFVETIKEELTFLPPHPMYRFCV